MKFKAISDAITSKAGSHILKVRAHSPAILFGAGVVGVVATVVLACKATLKLDAVLDEHAETMAKLNLMHEESEDVTDEIHKRNKMILMARTSGRITKLYLPGVAVGLLSICALTGSHIVLTRRNMAVTAAYAALDKGFREYRERVVNELGQGKDDEFRYGYEDREVAVDTDKGVVVKTVRTVGPNGESVYAKFFDQLCGPFEQNSESNRVFLQCQQGYWNDRLHARGYVFLNEVYKALGIEETRAGQTVGWALRPGVGDHYISFGLFDRQDNFKVRDFVNGRERAILLDFNVDGPILNDVIKKEV